MDKHRDMCPRVTYPPLCNKNDKDTPEHCCRSELMHSENAPNYIFSMFEAFCEDIKLDKRTFDERYGKSFYEAIENFEASVSIG